MGIYLPIWATVDGLNGTFELPADVMSGRTFAIDGVKYVVVKTERFIDPQEEVETVRGRAYMRQLNKVRPF